METAKIDTGIWNDPFFVPLTREAKLVSLFLLTSSVLAAHHEIISQNTGLSLEAVSQAVSELRSALEVGKTGPRSVANVKTR